MRILLTNDDGIYAPGIAVLEKIARAISDDVWVVAPETDQSGFAHSLSISEPLRIREIDDRHFAVRGTPTDCVIMGVREILDRKPDLILSGINAGSNVADDVTYSGTIAGAMEGTMVGIRSIALSQTFSPKEEGGKYSFDCAEVHGVETVRKLLTLELPAGTFINVNFPACKPGDVAGLQVTHQGKMNHGLSIDAREDGRGIPYYWLRFGRAKSDIVEGSDLAAMRDNKISVTPLKLDLTDYASKEALEKVLA
ncbi:5'/3'-nucleotidase SurE [Limoniibacter endophyticus]|uniref:5'-nucleotidase SurE n=1 Tax=Limoniibacter endophyticus TaxID=1565040 RepID=A0A8J3DF32_9HYPH|nr:5'/3'-nucleotidase SurE [Limoniibacter endophyticus]GHC62803.1 5'-nucleotidase SurE [Limoniibacter endophyticus]